MLKRMAIGVFSTLVWFSGIVAEAKKAEALIIEYPTEIAVPFPPGGGTITIIDRTQIDIPVLIPDFPPIGPVCLSCPPNIFGPIGFIERFDPLAEIARVSEIFTGFNRATDLSEVFPEASEDTLGALSDLLTNFSSEDIQFTGNTIFGNVTGKAYAASLIADTTVGDLGQFFQGDDLEQISAQFADFASEARIVIAQHEVPVNDLVSSDPKPVPEPGMIAGLSAVVMAAGTVKRKLRQR
ncbi:MAG: PEP-CTERM sorting domain-containing protein [Oscillatoriales cyanobacterium RM2_1_1]|nr:PEP-CTERM sorting domain-containing protein [Oscillatoriales cyanobacterium SM2_3_0]NJO44429.1 PEP-CTERM sorting domain-containing protein [Oscillatoriales cyanobacterium RM2_1_1]